MSIVQVKMYVAKVLLSAVYSHAGSHPNDHKVATRLEATSGTKNIRILLEETQERACVLWGFCFGG